MTTVLKTKSKKSDKLARLKRTAGAAAAESLGRRKGGVRGPTPPPVPAHLVGVHVAGDVFDIPLGLIKPDPNQPRKTFAPEALRELADNLLRHGQLQPCRVRLDKAKGCYVLVSGERRFRAAGMARFERLRCVVEETNARPGALTAQQLAENCARADVPPLETAHALRKLRDHHKWSQRQIAEETGLSTSNVTRLLALLELPETVKGDLMAGRISASAGYEISKLESVDDQVAMRDKILNGATHAEVVAEVKKARAPEPVDARPLFDGRAADVEPNPSLRIDPQPAPLSGQGVLLETPGAKKRDAGTPDGWSRLDFGHQVEFTLGVAEGVYVTVAIEKPSKVSVTEAVERALGQLQKKQAVA